MADFVKLAMTATRLIAANGRDVTFIKLDATPTNPAQPWRGNADPRVGPAGSITVRAVNVSDGGLGMRADDNELLKRSEKQFIVAGSAGAALETYNEILDGTARWRILFVDVLEPAGTRLLYFVGVAK